MIDDSITQKDWPLFTSGSKISLTRVFLNEKKDNENATFELLVRELPADRNFLVFMGLEQIINYLVNFRFTPKHLSWIKKSFGFNNKELDYLKKLKFTGDLHAMPEGTIFFPNEPVIKITAPIIEAQIIEMFIVNTVYYQTILASKVARFIQAAGNKDYGIGFNRSYGLDTAIKASRIFEIFKLKHSLSIFHHKHNSHVFGAGTFHYFIKSFENETDAYRAYLKHMKGRGYILVDTYGTIPGIKRYIKAALEYKKQTGHQPTGIQLDSGNLYKLSLAARKMLDRAGLKKVKIMAMSNLDEKKVARLEAKKAPIDLYAAVTGLLTPEDSPTLELVYKLTELQVKGKKIPKMKISAKKSSLPGSKQVFRIKKHSKYSHHIIGLENEKINGDKLLYPIIKKGKLMYTLPDYNKIYKHFQQQKSKFNSKLFNVFKTYNFKTQISPALKKLTIETKKTLPNLK